MMQVWNVPPPCLSLSQPNPPPHPRFWLKTRRAGRGDLGHTCATVVQEGSKLVQSDRSARIDQRHLGQTVRGGVLGM